jgi:hypothetical protein
MPRKKKTDDLQSIAQEATTETKPTNRQPRVLGWLVLILGGASTFYWYKPLSNGTASRFDAHASALQDASLGPISVWSRDDSLVPLVDNQEIPNRHSGNDQAGSHESFWKELTGTPKVTLVPLNETQHDLRDLLKTEVLPRIPIKPDFDSSSIPSDFPSAIRVQKPEGATVPSNASGLGKHPANRDAGTAWPDTHYAKEVKREKQERKEAARITTQIPPLLEAGKRTIRTEEEIHVPPQFIKQPK